MFPVAGFDYGRCDDTKCMLCTEDWIYDKPYVENPLFIYSSSTSLPLQEGERVRQEARHLALQGTRYVSGLATKGTVDTIPESFGGVANRKSSKLSIQRCITINLYIPQTERALMYRKLEKKLQ